MNSKVLDFLKGYRRRGRASVLLLCIAMLGALLAACGDSDDEAEAGQLSTIRFMQVVPDPNNLPIFAAMDEGYLEDEGIRIEVITSTTGPVSLVQALIGGSVDVAANGYPPVITAVANGGPVVVVAGVAGSVGNIVVAKKEFTSFAELSGKKVGVTSPTDISRIAFEEMAAKEGLDPSEVTYVYSSGTS